MLINGVEVGLLVPANIIIDPNGYIKMKADRWIGAPIRWRMNYERWVCQKCGKSVQACADNREIGGDGPGIIYWHHKPDGGLFDVGPTWIFDRNGRVDIYEYEMPAMWAETNNNE